MAKKIIVPVDSKRSLTIWAVKIYCSTFALLIVRMHPVRIKMTVAVSYSGLSFSPSRKMPNTTPYTTAIEEVPVSRTKSANGSMTKEAR